MDRRTYEIKWIQSNLSSMKTATNNCGELIAKSQLTSGEQLLALNGVMQAEGSTNAYHLIAGEDDGNNDNAGDGSGGGNIPNTDDDIDQIAAENLIFMARDGQIVADIIGATTESDGTVVVAASDSCAAEVLQQAAVVSTELQRGQQHLVEGGSGAAGEYVDEFVDDTPQIITEEVITDDWVQRQGEERVEIPVEQIIGSGTQVSLDMDVPLPTVQDEYTALRPYPCDFCSRRFRKKTNLMNHMVAHQNDRPHLCKLCGSRFFRRSDLINHLKAHADAPDPEMDAEFMHFTEKERPANDHYYEQDWTTQIRNVQRNEKSSRKSHNASGNSSSTSTSTTVGRGRISRLKPKEEVYVLNEPLANETEAVYDDCQQLQASTAVVKFTQNQSPAHEVNFPIIDESKPFVCQQCGLAFARQKALQAHTKIHSEDQPHECSDCNEMFWDAASLQEHQKMHQFVYSNSEYDPEEAEADETQSESESERLYGEFYCSECGVSFHREDLLRKHAKTHAKSKHDVVAKRNDKDQQHCCNTCGETFAEALDLLAHAEIHARSPPFKCVLCGESFFEEVTIKRHLQTVHQHDMTPNSCILCGKECRDRKALIKHAWDHSREKCHSCSKCGKSFHNKARLKRHMSSHRDKSVICDVCQEEFPDGRSLSNHRHSHTNAPGKMFPCNECGKTFGSRSSQQIHVRIHTGEKPYGCRFCWKAFADGGTLRKHERIHTGEKPYACSVCARAFNQRVVLREHIRSHHSGLDAKRNTYHCTVCAMDMSSSGELVKHLIQHSDMNTAMQRQPVTGPRKYKRRRKLKPHEIAHEIARLRKSDSQQNDTNGSDIDISDFDIVDNVDDILGITETTPPPSAKANAKSKRDKNRLSSNTNTLIGDSEHTLIMPDNDLLMERPRKPRYRSTGSNSDSLWQTKLINSNTLLSNLENTLQSIDTLVVGSTLNQNADSEERRVRYKSGGEPTTTPPPPANSSGSQRTQEVRINKNQVANRTRKRTEKSTTTTTTTTNKAMRPRMIHTEKLRINGGDGVGRKRSRSKQQIVIHRQQSDLAHVIHSGGGGGATTIDNDYDMITAAAELPKQISSSPSHMHHKHTQNDVRQQHEQPQQQRSYDQHTRLYTNAQQPCTETRNLDLYDTKFLDGTSTLRKEAYEKFNPSIVNDLEEILRSPIKCDRTERHRYISESSTQFLEEEQHNMIKIEPTSPDLREIVVGVSSGGGGGDGGVGIGVAGSSSNERIGSYTTRTPRKRNSTVNRKYLEFEADVQTHANAVTRTQKRSGQSGSGGGGGGGGGASRSKQSKCSRQEKLEGELCNQRTPTSYTAATYSLDVYGKSAGGSGSLVSVTDSSFSSLSPTDGGVASIVAATEPLSPAVTTQPERRRRYFECEMCSAIFPDRAQLLDHVPIHI